MDVDEWSEEEESTVVVEIQGIIEPDFLAKIEKARVLGIDTECPYLQLDDNTFKGKYQDTLGTCLLFKDISEKGNDDKEENEEEAHHQLEYSCKTYKKLCMQRIFIKPSTAMQQAQESTPHREGSDKGETDSKDNSTNQTVQESSIENMRDGVKSGEKDSKDNTKDQTLQDWSSENITDGVENSEKENKDKTTGQTVQESSTDNMTNSVKIDEKDSKDNTTDQTVQEWSSENMT